MSAVSNAQDVFSGTIAPTGSDVLDETKLTAWMEEHVEGFQGPLTQSKFAGGQSNPTYKISAPSGNYVLRRKPFGPLLPSAHAVDREYKVQAGLYRAGFPIARQFGLCTDNDVLGSWFYVMQMVDGHTIWDGAMPGATPDHRRATYNAMIDTLAALHNVDVDAAGLSDYGKPGNYFGRQVERWTKQYRLSETEVMPEMEQLLTWLPATLPTQDRTSIVHGDYRIDNMIWSHDRPEILAVLDWELSTLGDPLADFAYVAMAWVTENGGRSGVMDVDRAALGIPELDEMVARYCEKTDRDGLPDLNWYLAFNFFRLAAIMQGIKKRVIDGTANSAHAQDMSDKVRPLAQRAMDFARKADA
ncbi:phosphotransferase family protein [Sphingopyxis yananensis]|uniref:phosphotransferase family protein n=1 Tax=Sphingopyxis yananensis TaxID=2886687 RepID=UPI001D10E323|nr:phosphotransferase family protein [Sphingopyxis yananensis]MCC2601492.1 phosphotransferase family protein [Sphingopyxis yananensis]